MTLPISSSPRDLAEQIGQDRRIADVACGDLDGLNFQRLFVDPEVNLAPNPPFRAAMLAGVPLAFALHLDPPRHGHSDQWRSHGSMSINRCSGPLERKPAVRAVCSD